MRQASSASTLSLFTPLDNTLPKDLADIKCRLLKILGAHSEEDIHAVFEQILKDKKFVYLVDFAGYCLRNDSNLNRVFFGLITHPMLLKFWRKMAITLPHGNQYSILVTPKPKFVFTELELPDSITETNQALYWFRMLAGLKCCSIGALKSTVAIILRESLAEISRGDYRAAEEKLLEIAGITSLASDTELSIETKFHITCQSNQLDYPLTLLLAFLKIKRGDYTKALLLLRATRGINPALVKPIAAAQAHLYLQLKDDTQFAAHLDKYIIDDELSKMSGFFLQAFWLYREGNWKAGDKFFKGGEKETNTSGTPEQLITFQLYAKAYALIEFHLEVALSEKYQNLKSTLDYLQRYLKKAPDDLAVKCLKKKVYEEFVQCHKLLSKYQEENPDSNPSKQTELIAGLTSCQKQESDDAKTLFTTKDEATLKTAEWTKLNSLSMKELNNKLALQFLDPQLILTPLKLSDSGTQLEPLAFYYKAYQLSLDNSLKKALYYLGRLQKIINSHGHLTHIIEISLILIRLRILEDPRYTKFLDEAEVRRSYQAILRSLEKLYTVAPREYYLALLISSIYNKLSDAVNAELWLSKAEADKKVSDAKLSTEDKIKIDTLLEDPKNLTNLSTLLVNLTHIQCHFFSKIYAQWMERFLHEQTAGLETTLEAEIMNQYKSGAMEFNNFSCLDQLSGLDLMALKKIKAKENVFPTELINTLLARAKISTQYHWAAGFLLEAEVYLQIAKCHDRFYLAEKKSLIRSTTAHADMRYVYETAPGAEGLVDISDHERRRNHYYEQALISFTVAERLAEDSAPLLHNILYGTTDPLSLSCLEMAGVDNLSALKERYHENPRRHNPGRVEALIAQAVDRAMSYLSLNSSPIARRAAPLLSR